MSILIETYRGWNIYFNPENEEFHTDSDKYDKEAKKRSYSSVKTFIDNYIKENETFVPFDIWNNGHWGKSKLKVVGIRKDGRLNCVSIDGKQTTLSSEYDLKNYYLANDRNEPLLEEIEQLKMESQSIVERINFLRTKLITESVLQKQHELAEIFNCKKIV